MKYDRDLKRFRAFIVVLIALNASMTVLCAVRREWVAGFASIAWAVSAGLMLRSIRVLQETRNHIAGTEQWRAEWRAMMAEAAAKGKEALAELGTGAEAALAADEEQRKRADRVKHWLN